MSSDRTQLNHPILEQSFAIIDHEVGQHSLNPEQYAIARRVIHATADFEYLNLLKFSPNGIARGIEGLKKGVPIITDVTMVKVGIKTLVEKTFNNPIISAVEQISQAQPGKTRTETGLIQCYARHPQGMYVIGNAPTALLALCELVKHSSSQPSLIVGVPVGFVSVVESKRVLAQLDVPYILVQGRKGGSAVAAAILNALLILAWDSPV